MTNPVKGANTRTMSRKWIRGSMLVGALAFLVGCEQLTEPQAAMAQQESEQRLQLPSFGTPGMPSLMRQVREAIRSGDHPEAEAFLRQARELRQEAMAARRDGDRDGVREKIEASRDATISAVLSVLGSSIAEDAVAARAERLARMRTRLGEASPRPERAEARIAAAEERLAEAERLLASNDPHGALKALGAGGVRERLRAGAPGGPRLQEGMRGRMEGMREQREGMRQQREGMREHRDGMREQREGMRERVRGMRMEGRAPGALMRQRMHDMSDEERAQMRQRMHDMSDEERSQMRQRMHDMSDEERAQMRQRMRDRMESGVIRPRSGRRPAPGQR